MTSTRNAGPLAGADQGDDRMRALDRYWCELADHMREPGETLDREPDAIGTFLDLPAVRFIRERTLPAQYRTDSDLPGELLDAAATCHGVVTVMERAGYGDPGIVPAAPGPSLSGAVVRALADDAQSDWYYGRLASEPTYTFFGLTEPAKGSAAIELATTLTPAPDSDGWLLNGEKRYVGNGARAQLGVVFARRAAGPLGIEAVLVDTSAPGFSAGLLPMIGLRGARISWLRFEDVRIPADHLLGARLRPSRRGLQGALYGLYRFRPGIAALALGCADATRDYLGRHRCQLAKADQFEVEGLADRIAAVRGLLHRVAVDMDHDRGDPQRISAVKAQAAQVAEEMTTLATRLLGPASLIEHPWLEKTCRDVRAFDIMEGPANLHRLAVFQGLRKATYLPGGGNVAGH